MVQFFPAILVNHNAITLKGQISSSPVKRRSSHPPNTWLGVMDELEAGFDGRVPCFVCVCVFFVVLCSPALETTGPRDPHRIER